MLIEINQQQQKLLLECVNIMVKTIGLNAAQGCLILAKILQSPVDNLYEIKDNKEKIKED